MDSHESVASRALAIPEILASVLLLLQDHDDQPLISCTLVNSLWAHEANALLWERCGSHSSINGIPTIRALISVPPARRHLYADMVRILSIQVQENLLGTAWPQNRDEQEFDRQTEQYEDADQSEMDMPEDNQEGTGEQEAHIQNAYQQDHELSTRTYDSDEFNFLYPPGSWAGVHLAQLRGTSFPQLEELHVDGPAIEEDKSSFQPNLLLQFLQPKLKRLFMFEGDIHCDMISVELLEHLEQNCQGLETILIEPKVVTVGVERFRSFLMSMPALRVTFPGWSEYMSTGFFQALSRLPQLKRLFLKVIEDELVDSVSLYEGSSDSIFASLTEFTCSITAHGLRGMLPYLSGIRRMYVEEIDATPRLWKALSLGEFKFLESLSLYLHEDTVMDANEFLRLLQHAPAIQDLTLSHPRKNYDKFLSIRMEPFDDNIMEAIAKRLPVLQTLDLRCKSDRGLVGENGLLALGVNCPLLRSIKIEGNIDWARFVEISPQGLWSRLNSLHVRDFSLDRNEIIEDNHRELARQIKVMMPCLDPQGGELNMGRSRALEHAVLEEFADGQDWQQETGSNLSNSF